VSETQLPSNWSSSALEELLDFVVGGDWGKDPEFADDDYLIVRCIRGSEFRNWKTDKGRTASIRKVKKSSIETRRLCHGDILVEISGGGPDQPVGRTVLIDSDSLAQHKELDKVCTNFLRLARPNRHIDSSYLNYFLQCFYNSGEITNYQSGSNNLRNLKFKEYISISIPLAPLNEQIRIANKLDSLLAKVDTAQARLERIPTLLKRFRQSVLAAATSGELTREWRGDAEFGITVRIGDLTTDIRYGTSKKCSYDEGDIAVLRIPNIGDGKIDAGDLKFAYFDKDEKEKLSLKRGDILIIRSNGSVELVGKAALVSDKDNGYLFAGYLIRIRFSDDVQVVPKYILFCFQSPVVRNVVELNARSTSGINNINSKELAALEINLPSTVEQTEIVRRVESLFALADTVEKQYLAAKQRLDRLSQSLLAKAFRGELVPQDPNDEPAAELLKRIQAERQAQPAPKQKRSKPA
jgi:type I restriction enzyme S subunit